MCRRNSSALRATKRRRFQQWRLSQGRATFARVHRRERRRPRSPATKAAPEKGLNASLPVSTRLAIENWTNGKRKGLGGNSPPDRDCSGRQTKAAKQPRREVRLQFPIICSRLRRGDRISDDGARRGKAAQTLGNRLHTLVSSALTTRWRPLQTPQFSNNHCW